MGVVESMYELNPGDNVEITVPCWGDEHVHGTVRYVGPIYLCVELDSGIKRFYPHGAVIGVVPLQDVRYGVS